MKNRSRRLSTNKGHNTGMEINKPGPWPLAQPSTACPINWAHEPKFRTLVHALLAVDRWVPPGAIIDAGANVGKDSCFFAEHAPDRTVHAIEPLALNVRHIRDSFGRMPNLVVTHGGLGDRSERVELRSSLSLGSQMRQKRGSRWQDGAPDQKLVEPAGRPANLSAAGGFQVFTIDELFAPAFDTARPGSRVGLVHLDVEGMEPAALRGAARTLLRDRPVLTTEVSRTRRPPRSWRSSSQRSTASGTTRTSSTSSAAGACSVTGRPLRQVRSRCAPCNRPLCEPHSAPTSAGRPCLRQWYVTRPSPCVTQAGRLPQPGQPAARPALPAVQRERRLPLRPRLRPRASRRPGVLAAGAALLRAGRRLLQTRPALLPQRHGAAVDAPPRRRAWRDAPGPAAPCGGAREAGLVAPAAQAVRHRALLRAPPSRLQGISGQRSQTVKL